MTDDIAAVAVRMAVRRNTERILNEIKELATMDQESQKTPRNPEIDNTLRWLTPNPNLPAELPAIVAHWFWDLAIRLVEDLPDGGPELVAGLRKLLEAKDCMVRAAIDADPEDQPEQGPGITISQFERGPGGWSRADRHQA